MPLQFDIRAILQRKAPKAHVPGFVIRYLERIAHVKQMNAFLRKYPDLEGYAFIDRVIHEVPRSKGLRIYPRTVVRLSSYPITPSADWTA